MIVGGVAGYMVVDKSDNAGKFGHDVGPRRRSSSVTSETDGAEGVEEWCASNSGVGPSELTAAASGMSPERAVGSASALSP